jgi:hypothetical protein
MLTIRPWYPTPEDMDGYNKLKWRLEEEEYDGERDGNAWCYCIGDMMVRQDNVAEATSYKHLVQIYDKMMWF